ncbi:hypothetical protein BCR34DRAFT_608222 [Clohesyomyces aquaticus]|uniref:Uncharacterized protein n=1 Tax=Clohesyomyces aquaticus TaxID=1231657 RepID=A0A1Y1Y9B6_9PLEO|nr:hypothetical protein BCR34DRAFT_608222 [Clohesyomyces aquaticus]
MEPIAITGFAFRLPQGTNDTDTLWKVLSEGKSLMSDWPKDRIQLESFYDADPRKQNTIRAKGGHFLGEDPALFDAPFFSITASEAAAMDPQQRMMLETCYLALENAGVPMEKAAGSRTAVYEASMADDYSHIVCIDGDTMPRTAATGTARCILANRVSWFFNLLGPSLHIDTACSGSMVAVDLACNSLRNGDSSMALVAGANLILTPEVSMMLSRMNFLSPDSLCHSFDSRANGYSRGEGMIVMVLKRLCDAVKDGDMIRAVIRSNGTNQDGRTPGLTQPSAEAQEQLIREVYQKAGLDFASTRYVEAHGTGTPVGDPLEIKAIGRVFRTSRSSEKPLYVGSAKSNMGHLEGGSGLVGILKSVLMLEKAMIVPNALFEEANPDLDLEFSNIQIPTKLTQWPCAGLRRISVNSFGFGGTNSHVVLDDAYHYLQGNGMDGNHCTYQPTVNGHLPQPTVNGYRSSDITNGFVKENDNLATINRYQLLVWSASDETALKRRIAQFSSYYHQQVSGDPDLLERLAYTLSERRSHMLWRSFALVNQLHSDPEADLSVSKQHRSSLQTGIAFVFTGQGAEYAKMGLELSVYPIFRETLENFQNELNKLGCTWSLLEKMKDQHAMGRPQYSQPLCTALQIALVELLRALNVLPNAVAGHSSGEIAAAYTAGILSLESACKVAYYRGLLAEQLSRISTSRGGMMSVNLAPVGVDEYLRTKVDIRRDLTVACINSPQNVTVSGEEHSIDILKAKLDEDGIFAYKLKTGMAYHSPAMQAISSEYIELMDDLTPNAIQGSAKIPMISTVTGGNIMPKLVSKAEYWVRNLISPVQFSDAVSSLLENTSKVRLGMPRVRPVYDIVEIGPHGALRRPCMDIIAQSPRKGEVRYTSVLDRNQSSIISVMSLVGTLYSYGYPVSVLEANKLGAKNDNKLGILTDLPQYPFDHSQRYWHESRMSYDFRMREPVPTSVLGSRVHDWNPLEPRWRKIINTEEMPWVHDHVVSGSCIFPATGMLIMAVEAVKLSLVGGSTVRGFLIKTAEFKSPIPLKPDDNGESSVETITSLVPLRKSHEKDSSWFEVWISTQCARVWKECFRCTIQVQYMENNRPFGGNTEQEFVELSARKTYSYSLDECTRPLTARSFYKYCKDRGITYGPTFSILEDIRCQDECTAVGSIDVSRPELDYEGFVHPAILDAACQVCWLAPTKGLVDSIPTEIPRRIRNTYIAASGWKAFETSRIRIVSTATIIEASKGVEGQIIVLADDGTLLCQVGCLELSPVATDDGRASLDRKLLHGIRWAPCLSILNPVDIATVCKADAYSTNEEATTDYTQKLTEALCLSMSEVLHSLSADDIEHAPPHLQKYISWMKRVITNRNPSFMSPDTLAHSVSTELDIIESLRPNWAVYTCVARNLSKIIRGSIDPLSLIFSTNLVETFYADIFASMCDSRLHTYLSLASHETPNLAILEVGAGTGGFTNHILSILEELEERDGGTKFSRYMYTDISHAFFDDAREKFERFARRMEFRSLDLEKTIQSQGFEEGVYDMVIAGSVLHTTKSLSTTLEHLRKALKPGGKLLFFEITGPNVLPLQFGFGILPGWWYGTESWREGDQDQVTNEKRWHELLVQNGYSGNDLVLRDHESDICHSWSILMSTAMETPNPHALKPRMVLCYDDSVEIQRSVAVAIREREIALEVCVQAKPLLQLASTDFDPEDVLVCLYEVGNIVLGSLREVDFAALQSLMRTARKILWISASDSAYPTDPFFHLASGFMRTMRNEMSNSKIVTLILEGCTNDIYNFTQHVESVFQKSFLEGSLEVEYMARDRQLHVGRLHEEKATNYDMLSGVYPSLRLEPWGQGPPIKFSIGVPGALDSLQFVEDEVTNNDLTSHEVEIEARAWGLSFRDIFVALGRLEESDFGLDTSGIVTRVGSDCARIRPGDRVVMLRCGSLRKLPRAHELEVVRIPDSMSYEDAASFPGPAATAYHCLVKVARLERGEKALIHAAAGATGQLAVQIAMMVGAEVFATVGSGDKRELLMALGVADDHIFYSRDTDFARGIHRLTGGYGVDVVLNSLSGDGLKASWECIAPFGRFIEIGKADIVADSGLPMASFKKNASFIAVDLRHIGDVRKQVMQNLLSDTFGLLADGKLKYAEPRHVYPVSSIEDAFRFLQSGKNTGRIVINNKPSDVVPKYIMNHQDWKFNENASYLIAGGLGGIGRGISRWMMSKGVKSLILPSRSGPKSPAAIELLEELRQHGVNVMATVCDVSSFSSLSAMLDDCAASMPPIKGCINACMTLQDSVFDNMTYSQWNLAISSKVHTSLHLHCLLPHNLDFFIFLSSLSGIFGNLSQSNYAAGNVFQDALAYDRCSRGEKALSINLGWMRTIGAVAENASYQNFRMEGSDMAQIEERELMSLLDIYCDPGNVYEKEKSQILIGTITPAHLQTHGLEVPDAMKRPLFSGFAIPTGNATEAKMDSEDVAALFKIAGSDAKRAELVVQALAKKLARSLSKDPDDLDIGKPLFEYGVDSLVAVELRNWIGKEFAADVAVFDLMGGATIAAVGALVAGKGVIGKAG